MRCSVGAAALAVAAAVLIAGCGGAGPRTRAVTISRTVVRTQPAPPTLADVVARVRSGVIRIETTTCDSQGVGTGLLLGPRLVATVEHVVDGAVSIRLLRNGQLVGRGTVIGADPARDVALVQSNRPIEGYRFTFARRAPRLGEEVTAIGFPLGLPLSVTRGSVSGLNRSIPINDVQRNRLVQTDAAVNPGNSGGPLMTDSGEVVGLVDLGTDQANGLAFAVSAEVAAPLLQGWSAAPQPVAAASCETTPTQAAAPPPAPATTAAAPQVYSGSAFSIDYPAGWVVTAAEADKGTYLDTTIQAPNDPTLMIRIDESAGTNAATPDEAAAPVITGMRQLPSYQEVSLGHVTFEGLDALWWEFEVSENGVRLHKVDLFFIDANGNGWGLLTQAPAADWAQDAAAFGSYRQTFQPNG